MSKKKDPTTEIKTLSKPRTWHEAMERQSWLYFPDKDEWRKRLINTMYEWAQSDDALEITQFCFEWKMRRQLLYEWRDKYPDIKEAMNEIKLYLGIRRRNGALLKRFDKDMALRDMHCYDPEWHEINKYHADLKRLEGPAQGIVVVEIPAAPDTGRVKQRITKTESSNDTTI